MHYGIIVPVPQTQLKRKRYEYLPWFKMSWMILARVMDLQMEVVLPNLASNAGPKSKK